MQCDLTNGCGKQLIRISGLSITSPMNVFVVYRYTRGVVSVKILQINIAVHLTADIIMNILDSVWVLFWNAFVPSNNCYSFGGKKGGIGSYIYHNDLH